MKTNFACALVGAASFEANHFKNERFGVVVAVDGGYASLKDSGVKPDFAIGDFDSLGYTPLDVPIEQHPSMKDDSDTALALAWAQVRGYGSAAVYGALGARLDHTHATLAAIVCAARQGMRVAAVGEGFVVAALSSCGFGSLELPASMKGTFSVFSASDISAGVTEVGSKYEVADIAFSSHTTLGLSNEFEGKSVRISVKQGDLLVYLPLCPLSALRFS